MKSEEGHAPLQKKIELTHFCALLTEAYLYFLSQFCDPQFTETEKGKRKEERKYRKKKCKIRKRIIKQKRKKIEK